jgi:hypothetical protein
VLLNVLAAYQLGESPSSISFSPVIEKVVSLAALKSLSILVSKIDFQFPFIPLKMILNMIWGLFGSSIFKVHKISIYQNITECSKLEH